MLSKYRLFLCTQDSASALCIYGARSHAQSHSAQPKDSALKGALFKVSVKKVTRCGVSFPSRRPRIKSDCFYLKIEHLGQSRAKIKVRTGQVKLRVHILFLQLHSGLDHPDGVHQRVRNES